MPAFSPIHFTSGPVVVSWNASQLGYGENGARISVIPRYADIHSDDFGGQEGYPTDSQFLGAVASINIALTKYNKDYCDKLGQFNSAALAVSGKTGVGLFPAIGSFVRQDALYAGLLLDGVNEHLTFPTAFLRGNYEINAGTIYRTYMVQFECWMNQTDYTSLTQAQTRRVFTMTATV